MDKNLIAYVEQRNHLAAFMRSHGGQMKSYDVNALTAEDKAELLQQLESDLSPESLTCDGELRGTKLVKKTKLLIGAKAALEAL